MLTTLYYLKPRQFYYRVLYKLRDPVPYRGPRPVVRCCGSFIEPIERPNAYAKPRRFTFMNHSLSFDESIDWNTDQAPRLWLYNLHYFDFLQSSALRDNKLECTYLMHDWIAKNPSGVGQGWDAYTLSLRIVNWIKWSLRSNHMEWQVVDSMAEQAHWLNQCVEHQLMANHVLANAKALVFAGVYLDGEAPRAWLTHGLQLLAAEHQRQILADGGHCERSAMYHAIMLEDILDLINLAQAYPQQIPDSRLHQWQQLSTKMQAWLSAMSHPDGEIAFFNDATQKFAVSPLAIADYANRLGVLECVSAPDFRYLENTGFIRLEHGNAVLIADVGNVGPAYQPGHAHAGTLSFELSLHGKRVIVNSGISTYSEGPLRHKQRSTCSHNTMEVAGENSSEVWASFRVARRARTHQISLPKNGLTMADHGAKEGASLMCSFEHDGYRFLRANMKHRRKIHWFTDKLIVTDQLSEVPESAVVRYYLHPDMTVMGQHLVAASSTNQRSEIARWHMSGADVRWEQTHWHPELGLAIENWCLVATLTAQRCEFTLDWSS